MKTKINRVTFIVATLSAAVQQCSVAEGDGITEGRHGYTPDYYIAPTSAAVKAKVEWFRDQKLALMVHFGLYSQLGIQESWCLVDDQAYWSRLLIDWKDGEAFKREYWSLNRSFNPVRFQPEVWADAAARNGFKYLIFTTKHHDGFCLFDSKYSDYKVTNPECPYSKNEHADMVRALYDAFRARGLGISCYFSKPDWHSEDYWENHGLGYATTRMPSYDVKGNPEKWARYATFVRNQMLELVRDYGPLDALWLDGGQVKRATGLDIRIEDIIAEARRITPSLVAVDRGGKNTCEDIITPEQEVPPQPLAVPWESCITMGTGFSFRYDDVYKSPRELIHLLIDVVVRGGNLALNVAAAPDGRLPRPAIDRMDAMGAWLAKNGEAIYGTRIQPPFETSRYEGKVGYVGKGGNIYALRPWTAGQFAVRRIALDGLKPEQVGRVVHLASGREIPFRFSYGRLTLDMPEDIRLDEYADAFRIEPPVSKADYSRVACAAPTLGPDREALIAEIFGTRVAERTPTSDAAATLSVTCAIDPSLPSDDATVTVAGGKVQVRGGRMRALIFGLGELLRQVTWGARTFSIADGTYAFRPKNPFRQCYLSRHFDNWYHRAPTAEIVRYIDDMALWGMNAMHMQLDYPVVDQADADSESRRIFLEGSRRLGARCRALDLDLTTIGGENSGAVNMPPELRAEIRGRPRGYTQFLVCPAKPGGLDYLTEIRRKGLVAASGIPVTGYVYWPFDEGGCECDVCHPWGGVGFMKLMDHLRKMNEKATPGCKNIVSTWFFREEDWTSLWTYLEKRPGWIDYLIIDNGGEYPEFPAKHPVPGGIPVITFPEISMIGRNPWGGFGATPLPDRLERIYRTCEKHVSGYQLYSEGLFEDINKVIVTGLYVDPASHADDALRAYAHYELPGVDPQEFVMLCHEMESVHFNLAFGKPFCEKGDGTRGERVNETMLAASLATAESMAARVDRMDRTILASRHDCWRWRLFYLRAKCDLEMFRARSLEPKAAEPYFDELVKIYHAEIQLAKYRRGKWSGHTCPQYGRTCTLEVELDAPYRDGVVIPSGKPFAVTGTTAPGADVSIVFNRLTVLAEADGNGRFEAQFPAMAPSAGPLEMKVRRYRKDRILKDVTIR